jgi:hypothetical protein
MPWLIGKLQPIGESQFYFCILQGPTVASAPSVEHEDYRTPKPSVCSIGMNGKSFDLGGGPEPEGIGSGNWSDSNGLVKVREEGKIQ